MQITLRKLTRQFISKYYLSITNNILNRSLLHQNKNLLKFHRNLVNNHQYHFMTIATPFKTQFNKVMSISEFLRAHNIEYNETQKEYQIKYCPFCPKPHHNQRSNLYVLNLEKNKGVFHCFRCSSKGSWLNFRERILGFPDETFEHLQFNQTIQNSGKKKLADAQFFVYKSNLKEQQYKDVLDYLYSRGFKDQTIQKYNLGAGTEQFYNSDGQKTAIKCIYFPSYKILTQKQQNNFLNQKLKNQNNLNQNKNFYKNNSWTEIVKAKIRGCGRQNKRYMRQIPLGAQKGFFGLNLVSDSENTIVLTEGEYDAMAVYQMTGIPALSLPQGATNLSEGFLPYLQRFTKIILWMDNDDAGILNTSKMVDKLGINRTHIVKHNIDKMKDANDFLLSCPEKIAELIKNAKTLPDGCLLSFSALRNSIYAKISKTQQNFGLKVSWLPFFNKVVKGVRMGQLSVMSGPTGSGKTTFLTQVTLDLCKNDITVLWGSFQIRNQILITSMLYQFSDLKLDKQLSKFKHFADEFQKLPLHFMNFYGSHNIQKILSTIIYSIQKYNVHVVVIDTLQFLLSEQAQGFKKFQLQDSLIAKLRQISIKYNIHIIIVIHPRKTEDNEDIGIHSIYGTSKATQQADNVWLIQNRENYKLFQVKKNRYDGQLGRIPLGFNRNTKNFFQLTKDQFENLKQKEKTMSQIVENRQSEKNTKSQAQRQYQSTFDDEIIDTDLNRQRKSMARFQK